MTNRTWMDGLIVGSMTATAALGLSWATTSSGPIIAPAALGGLVSGLGVTFTSRKHKHQLQSLLKTEVQAQVGEAVRQAIAEQTATHETHLSQLRQQDANLRNQLKQAKEVADARMAELKQQVADQQKAQQMAANLLGDLNNAITQYKRSQQADRDKRHSSLQGQITTIEQRVNQLQQVMSDGLGLGSTAIGWLKLRGFEVTSSAQPNPEVDPQLDEIAIFLGENYDNLTDLYQVIKQSLTTKTEFQLDLRDRTSAIPVCLQFCDLLQQFGFLPSEAFYDPENQLIQSSLQEHPIVPVANFITGGWFERFVQHRISLLVANQQMDVDYLINPKVQFLNTESGEWEQGEFDLFLLINQQPIWIECKTGQYQAHLDKYGSYQARLRLPKAQALLMVLDLPEKERRSWAKRLKTITVISQKNLSANLGQAIKSSKSAIA